MLRVVVMTNTNIWTKLCARDEPYGLDGLQALLAGFAIDGLFAPSHPDMLITTMRELSVRAGSPTAARLGLTVSARTTAIRRLLARDSLRFHHPQLLDVWTDWMSSSDYSENYESVGRAVDPIASIAAGDTVVLIRLGSDLDVETSARTTELPLVRHEAEADLGRRLRMAGLADGLSLIAFATDRVTQ
jgi:hypothetical protein